MAKLEIQIGKAENEKTWSVAVNKVTWRSFTLSESATLSDALEVLDTTGMQIVLIVDSTGRFLGTVTDGDLRHAFRGQAPLSESVGRYVNRHPRTVSTETNAMQALEIMKRLAIRVLPVIDSQGAILDVLTLDVLMQPVDRETPVVIMAGGRGTRLGALTSEKPKPLLNLVDEPLAEVILRQLMQQGFDTIYFSVNYRAEDVRSYFGDGSRYGIAIDYLEEDEPLGTAGSLRLLPDTGSEHVLVVNGDLVTSADFGALLDSHVQTGADATVGLHEHFVDIPYGVVQVQNGRIVEIEEKPVHSVLVSAGVTALSRASLGLIAADGPMDMPELLQTLLVSGAPVRAWPLHSYWIDVGTKDQLERARLDHDLGRA